MSGGPLRGATLIGGRGRVLGVDLGSRRIGVAVSDGDQRVATGATAVLRGGDPDADRRALAVLASDYGAVGVVVGLPRSLSGRLGPSAVAALAEVDALRTALLVPVDTEDERLTSVAAAPALRHGGRRRAAARRARGSLDTAAATVLLQSWLDRRAASGAGA